MTVTTPCPAPPSRTPVISDSEYSVSPPNTGPVSAISANPRIACLRPNVREAIPITRWSVTVDTMSGFFHVVCAA